jgi:hypothetical protein
MTREGPGATDRTVSRTSDLSLAAHGQQTQYPTSLNHAETNFSGSKNRMNRGSGCRARAGRARMRRGARRRRCRGRWSARRRSGVGCRPGADTRGNSTSMRRHQGGGGPSRRAGRVGSIGPLPVSQQASWRLAQRWRRSCDPLLHPVRGPGVVVVVGDLLVAGGAEEAERLRLEIACVEPENFVAE